MLASLLRNLLIVIFFPINWLWWFLLTARRSNYKYSEKQVKFDLPVISIGNISHGGTGKTPITLWIARYFEKEFRTVIATRGYKSKFENDGIVLKPHAKADGNIHGDEPTLLIENLENTHIVIGKKRSSMLKGFFKENIKDVLLLEDGFQHLQIHRDLDIVLLDSAHDVRETLLYPLHYREPLQSLGDADIVILTNSHLSSDKQRQKTKEKIRKYIPSFCKVYQASYEMIQILDQDKRTFPLSFLTEKKILAFCGLAKPQNFWKSLEAEGAEIGYKISFPDHHTYTDKDVDHIIKIAQEGDYHIVTTEKDLVKVHNKFINHPLYWMQIDLSFGEYEESFRKDLKEAISKQEIQL